LRFVYGSTTRGGQTGSRSCQTSYTSPATSCPAPAEPGTCKAGASYADPATCKGSNSEKDLFYI